jgi:hypothetical protein
MDLLKKPPESMPYHIIFKNGRNVQLLIKDDAGLHDLRKAKLYVSLSLFSASVNGVPLELTKADVDEILETQSVTFFEWIYRELMLRCLEVIRNGDFFTLSKDHYFGHYMGNTIQVTCDFWQDAITGDACFGYKSIDSCLKCAAKSLSFDYSKEILPELRDCKKRTRRRIDGHETVLELIKIKLAQTPHRYLRKKYWSRICCRKVILTLLTAKNQPTSFFHKINVPKDVLVLISHYVWMTRKNYLPPSENVFHTNKILYE